MIILVHFNGLELLAVELILRRVWVHRGLNIPIQREMRQHPRVINRKKRMIQAYKLKGKIDTTVTESKLQSEKPRRRSKIKALQDWFEKTQPAPPDFDADEARWEALQEKYNL